MSEHDPKILKNYKRDLGTRSSKYYPCQVFTVHGTEFVANRPFNQGLRDMEFSKLAESYSGKSVNKFVSDGTTISNVYGTFTVDCGDRVTDTAMVNNQSPARSHQGDFSGSRINAGAGYKVNDIIDSWVAIDKTGAVLSSQPVGTYPVVKVKSIIKTYEFEKSGANAGPGVPPTIYTRSANAAWTSMHDEDGFGVGTGNIFVGDKAYYIRGSGFGFGFAHDQGVQNAQEREGEFALVTVAPTTYTLPDDNDSDGSGVITGFKLDKTVKTTRGSKISFVSTSTHADNFGGVYDIEVTYQPRNGVAAHVEIIHLTVSAMAERTVANVDLTSEANATRSIEVLDKALVEIGANQANLGALQNRMQYTINNLTQAAINIEMARGRITDADFAVETTVLAKHQILSQAASAMLAQANKSKQSVLTLLQ